MQVLSTLEGAEQMAVCTNCADQPPMSIEPESLNSNPPISGTPPTDETVKPKSQSTSRIRELTKSAYAAPPSEWPEALLEDLPDETRRLFQATHEKSGGDTGSLSDEYQQSMRSQGYVISEDARGLRITGAPKGGGTSELSATDLVRMAAELDGGVLPEAERRPCPQCQATIPPKAEQCQWCGYVLPTED